MSELSSNDSACSSRKRPDIPIDLSLTAVLTKMWDLNPNVSQYSAPAPIAVRGKVISRVVIKGDDQSQYCITVLQSTEENPVRGDHAHIVHYVHRISATSTIFSCSRRDLMFCQPTGRSEEMTLSNSPTLKSSTRHTIAFAVFP